MKQTKYDIVVIGSGLAGLYSALKLSQKIPNDNHVLLITKSKLAESNSYCAQGGMVAVLNDNTLDSVELHLSDTLKAGAGLNNPEVVKFVGKNSDFVVKDLLNFGVDFDKDDYGNYTLTKEAAHSIRRILHAGGDATGRKMELALCDAIKKVSNIDIYEDTMAVEILVQDNKVNGIVILRNEHEIILSNSVILATGGLGQLYKYTTNPLCSTGDGFALGYIAGADLQDMEFVQFHPTALAINNNDKNRFLISEAVRGEGAKLCNKDGYEFMHEYHEKKELAPRDIVARAIFSQMSKTNSDNVYLNATRLGKEKLEKRFPTIMKKCLNHGIDIIKDYIPVAPAAHYFMGGIKANQYGQTSIEGLYAIGEVSSTGLHGANRLASNSLLECVVCAFYTAEMILSTIVSTPQFDISRVCEKYSQVKNFDIEEVNNFKKQLKSIMWDYVGIRRTQESLETAKKELSKLEAVFDINSKYSSKAEYELRNMIITSNLIVKAALNRKESRGAHYRLDFLETEDIAKHSITNINKGEISFVK